MYLLRVIIARRPKHVALSYSFAHCPTHLKMQAESNRNKAQICSYLKT